MSALVSRCGLGTSVPVALSAAVCLLPLRKAANSTPTCLRWLGLLLVWLVWSRDVVLADTTPPARAYSGGTYVQSFDGATALAGTVTGDLALSSTGGTTFPSGWGMAQVGTNAHSSYGGATGPVHMGNVYCFDSSGNRSLGLFHTATLNPSVGVIFQNTTGQSLTGFTVSYTGKVISLGSAGRADHLTFSYSTSATSLSGTGATGFTEVSTLNFLAPASTGTNIPPASSVVGPVTVTLPTPLPPGGTLALRFTDPDVAGIDDTLAIDNFSFAATSAGTPSSATSGARIEEFRLSGPGGSTDEYICLYNYTDSPLDVGGWSLAAGPGAGTPVVTFPNATVIPGRGHLLVAGSSYSLANSGGTGVCAADFTYSADIPTTTGVALLNASGVVQDRAGVSHLYEGTTLAAAPGGQYAYVRVIPSGTGTGHSQDSNDNGADFNLLEVSSPTTTSPRLGTPGPQNLGSPIQGNGSVSIGLVDTSVASNTAPNQFRNTTPGSPGSSTANGTLSLRRRITNNTGYTIAQMRLRVVRITAGPPATGAADVRLLNSQGLTATVNGVTTPIVPTTVVSPADSGSIGAGLNTTLEVPLPAGGLAPGDSVCFEYLLGIAIAGTYGLSYSVHMQLAPLAQNRMANGGTSRRAGTPASHNTTFSALVSDEPFGQTEIVF
jgi:hypothetical protein